MREKQAVVVHGFWVFPDRSDSGVWKRREAENGGVYIKTKKSVLRMRKK
jgi:hypothetical protein